MCLANVGAGRVVDLDRVLWRRDLYIPAQPKLRTFQINITQIGAKVLIFSHNCVFVVLIFASHSCSPREALFNAIFT